MLSSTDSLQSEPKRDKPTIEIEDPRRAKLRRDMDEPMLILSSTDTADPKRAKPTSDSEEPTRAKHLNDSDDPRCKKSNTDIADPRRVILRRESELPSWAISITESENRDPKRDIPRMDRDAPTRAQDRSDTDDPRLV
jgi:hypothetical protein